MSLKQRFENEIVPELMKELGILNPLAVPRPKKVVVNIGLGGGKNDEKLLSEAQLELAEITGQKPNVRRARKSEAGWGMRTGDPIGLAVTLRGERMWAFLERLIRVTLPRVRDFRGIGKDSLDGRGNLSIGFEEHTVFPEIDPNEVGRLKGLEVSVVTSAESDEDGYKLLRALGMPFREEKS